MCHWDTYTGCRKRKPHKANELATAWAWCIIDKSIISISIINMNKCLRNSYFSMFKTFKRRSNAFMFYWCKILSNDNFFYMQPNAQRSICGIWILKIDRVDQLTLIFCSFYAIFRSKYKIICKLILYLFGMWIVELSFIHYKWMANHIKINSHKNHIYPAFQRTKNKTF